MSRVYRVELPVIGKVAALKMLDPDPLLLKLLGIQKVRDLFMREARAMAALDHPHIVAVHDYDQAGGDPFYVMDFFANNLGAMIGETYRADEPSRPIPVDKALEYTGQTLNGLTALHAAGVVHRDIKPYNLMVTAWDTIKICDFGLSRVRGEHFPGPSNLKVGSPFYTAPEQEAQPDDARATADLFSVGVMLYRMLTGRLPAAEGSAGVEPVSRLNPDLDNLWDDFLVRALARQPGDRFPSAPGMAEGLASLTDHWEARKAEICTPARGQSRPQPSPALLPLRTRPLKSEPRQARSLFELDPLWRPLVYTSNDFRIEDRIVTDRATGLVWQQSGCPTTRRWPEALEYVRGLNRERFAGRATWRLPTIAELNTLLYPAQHAHGLCIAPVFDPQLRWLWSNDRRSFIAAYYADLILGFVGWQDMSARYHVRAVSSLRDVETS